MKIRGPLYYPESSSTCIVIANEASELEVGDEVPELEGGYDASTVDGEDAGEPTVEEPLSIAAVVVGACGDNDDLDDGFETYAVEDSPAKSLSGTKRDVSQISDADADESSAGKSPAGAEDGDCDEGLDAG